MTLPAKNIVAGSEYFEQITGNESDRRARAAFQSIALNLVSRGGRVFDFGAGPGIDARQYAEHGLFVEAFDVDVRMCEFFAAHCKEFIASGQIVLCCGSYKEWLSTPRGGNARTFDLITSDFAPLNLIDDLQQLFVKFAAMTGPHGKVLISVLNPYYLGDLKYRWWWRNALRLFRDGTYFVQGSQARIHRRRPVNFAKYSTPNFVLKRAMHASPLSKRFMFLLFEKSDQLISCGQAPSRP